MYNQACFDVGESLIFDVAYREAGIGRTMNRSVKPVKREDQAHDYECGSVEAC